MADERFVAVFVLLHEVGDAAEGYLVDVLLHLVGGHADAAVADGEGLLLGVDFHVDGEVAQLALEVAAGREGLQFLRCVDSIANQLTQKYFMVRIKELLDDRKDILGLYIQFALHILIVVLILQLVIHSCIPTFTH